MEEIKDNIETLNTVEDAEIINSDELDMLSNMTGDEVNNDLGKENNTGNSTGNNINNDIDKTITDEHIRLPLREFMGIVNVSNLISASGEKSIEAMLVTFKVEKKDDKAVAHICLSDNKRNIEKDIVVLNKENYFTGFVAFQTQLLAKVVKVCSNGEFILIKRKVHNKDTDTNIDNYYMVVHGGEIALDTIKVRESKFVKDISTDSKELYSTKDLYNAIKRIYSYTAQSIVGGKGINFNKDTLQSISVNSVAKIMMKDVKYPRFLLSLIDVKILFSLISMDNAEHIHISKDGSIFTGETFRFKTEVHKAMECDFESVVDRLFAVDGVETSIGQLMSIVELSCALLISTGRVKLNYNDNGLVECKLLTRKDVDSIEIKGKNNKNVIKMERDIEIPSNTLRNCLSLFKKDETAIIRISVDGVSIERDNVRVAIIGKNATE